jgi:hypothetical protein
MLLLTGTAYERLGGKLEVEWEVYLRLEALKYALASLFVLSPVRIRVRKLGIWSWSFFSNISVNFCEYVRLVRSTLNITAYTELCTLKGSLSVAEAVENSTLRRISESPRSYTICSDALASRVP